MLLKLVGRCTLSVSGGYNVQGFKKKKKKKVAFLCKKECASVSHSLCIIECTRLSNTEFMIRPFYKAQGECCEKAAKLY